jgi:hypothetical protein
VPARSKERSCRRLLARIMGFESRRGYGCLSLVNVFYYQVEVPVMGRSLIRRSPIGCRMSECDLETSTRRKPRATRATRAGEP